MKTQLNWIEIQPTTETPKCDVLGYNEITGTYFCGTPFTGKNQSTYISTKNGNREITHYAELYGNN